MRYVEGWSWRVARACGRCCGQTDGPRSRASDRPRATDNKPAVPRSLLAPPFLLFSPRVRGPVCTPRAVYTYTHSVARVTSLFSPSVFPLPSFPLGRHAPCSNTSRSFPSSSTVSVSVTPSTCRAVRAYPVPSLHDAARFPFPVRRHGCQPPPSPPRRCSRCTAAATAANRGGSFERAPAALSHHGLVPSCYLFLFESHYNVFELHLIVRGYKTINIYIYIYTVMELKKCNVYMIL